MTAAAMSPAYLHHLMRTGSLPASPIPPSPLTIAPGSPAAAFLLHQQQQQHHHHQQAVAAAAAAKEMVRTRLLMDISNL
jgi:hypothetical protein